MNRWKIEIEIKKHGYTITTFAKKVNIERSTLWRKLNGITEFTVGEVRAICDALSIDDPREYFFEEMVAEKQC